MAGQIGNRNATTHGMRGFLAIGTLPKGAAYIRRCIGALRAACEERVLAVKGELSLVDAATCQSVARHEGRVLLATRWLRERADVMSDTERVAYLREISNGTDARDRALRSLGLDLPATDPWSVLNVQPTDDSASDEASE